MKRRIIFLIILATCLFALAPAQTRRRRQRPRPQTQQVPRTAASKYSAFLHFSEKHKSLGCNDCHKIPTVWTAKRDFPDVADFPDHDACVRCHRQQFFTRQAIVGTGPAICTVCHIRAAPREDVRFAFGNPNNANQRMKPKDERQFVIEFPHDKHQNAIAALHRLRNRDRQAGFLRALYFRQSVADDRKPDYNNCSICHVTNPKGITSVWADNFAPGSGTFKTRPQAHDACFTCHWKTEKPAADDCAGCHKQAATFIAVTTPKRISLKFAHEGGQGEHMMECTTCHINITRASTLRGLTPDVPINACASCHRDSKKTTYPKAVTIEAELEQFKKTGNCTYCHTSDVGKKQPPPSHDASVQ
ncbi:MAG TPA: cytochrome c3 family protein [Pyrinomonadaceae bacterium]|nr:cytochrome c3 family protein [Pyrinomonadaceae bacterium]